MSTLDIHPAPYNEQQSESMDDKKDDLTYGTAVNEVDVEKNARTTEHYIYENIPEGIDPKLIREEKVVRGLSERHLQVCHSRSTTSLSRS